MARRRIPHWILWLWNRARGYGYVRREDGCWHPRPGTCPAAILDDWSARACIRAGHCGCNEMERIAK